MEVLVIVILIIVFCYIYGYYGSKTLDKKIEEQRRVQAQINNLFVNRIKMQYPRAFEEYLSHYPCQKTSIEVLKNWSNLKWKEEESNLLLKDKWKKQTAEDKKWVQEQQEFAQKSYELGKSLVPGFGCYYYIVEIPSIDENGNPSVINMPIWQHFTYQTCLEKDLDYTNFPNTKVQRDAIEYYKDNGINLRDLYKSICAFIEKIIEGNGKCALYFSDNIEGWSDRAIDGTYSFLYNVYGLCAVLNPAKQRLFSEMLLMKGWDKNKYTISDDKSSLRIKLLKKNAPDFIIIIDAFTTNDKLKENCRFIFETLRDCHVKIVYISILKCFDRDEMIALINKANEEAKQKQAEEEAKRLEEEAKRKEEEAKKQKEEKTEEIDPYDEYAKRYIDLFSGLYQPTLFSDKAKEEWTRLSNNFYYTWLFYYYPTTCEFEANNEEWNIRRLVWNFKNDSGDINSSKHETALIYVVLCLKNKLADTFGEKYLQYLTLVCVPASTKEKNVARYKEFSKRLCDETGMINAYEHIHITKDGVSKKDPNNESNVSTQPEVSFDKEFFKDKYVLLFDDVVTKGSTMLRYKRKFEQLHVPVVGGICIGKTKHERPNNNNE